MGRGGGGSRAGSGAAHNQGGFQPMQNPRDRRSAHQDVRARQAPTQLTAWCKGRAFLLMLARRSGATTTSAETSRPPTRRPACTHSKTKHQWAGDGSSCPSEGPWQSRPAPAGRRAARPATHRPPRANHPLCENARRRIEVGRPPASCSGRPWRALVNHWHKYFTNYAAGQARRPRGHPRSRES